MGAIFASAQDTAQDIAYLWPDNVATWNHWLCVQTQWRTGGMGGATGLDYAGVSAYLSESGVEGDERKTVFSGIRAAEAGTLAGWAERRKSAQKD